MEMIVVFGVGFWVLCVILKEFLHSQSTHDVAVGIIFSPLLILAFGSVYPEVWLQKCCQWLRKVSKRRCVCFG